MAFYSRRMREEASIRRIGLVFMSLAFLIQFFAVVSPPKSTFADNQSVNSLVVSGVSSPESAAAVCFNNVRHYRDIMEQFNISCSAIRDGVDTKDGKPLQITANFHTNADDYYYSMGWDCTPNNQIAGFHNTPITIHDFEHTRSVVGTTCMRKLESFGNTKYDAIRVQDRDGNRYYIIKNCGNLVSVGAPQPRQYSTTTFESSDAGITTTSTISEGTTETKTEIPPQDVCPKPGFQAVVDASCDYCDSKPNIQLNFEDCDVCPRDGIQLSTSECEVTCNSYNPNVNSHGPATACFGDHCLNKEGSQGTSDNCDVCDNVEGIQLDKAQCDQCLNKDGIQNRVEDCDVCDAIPGIQLNSSECIEKCPYNTTLPKTDAACKPCDRSTSGNDAAACVVVHKTAANITAKLDNANGTTAHAGDVITYTLWAINTGKENVSQFLFQEDLSDVLDYADVADLHGGTMDQYKVVSWSVENLAAGATLSHQITVKVKDPIPQTPTDPAHPGHFDLMMSNVYGDVVNIKLPGNTTKNIEVASAKLPNTGPGTTLFIAACVVMVTGFFYGRARLLAMESELAVKENAGV